jgi:hypothetical protein
MKKIIIYAASAIILAGCGVSKNAVPTQNYSTGYEESLNKDYSGKEDQLKDADDRMIIYNANLTVIVKVPDTANAQLVRIAKKYQGYVQAIGTRYTTIRVLAKNLNDAIADISTIGKIRDRSIYGEDVTEEFTDLGIRLENAEKSRARYLELLNKAQNVTETVQVEKELERLNSEIDLLKGKINRIGHLTEYSTISVSLHEKVKPGILGYVFVYSYKAVRWLFVRN